MQCANEIKRQQIARAGEVTPPSATRVAESPPFTLQYVRQLPLVKLAVIILFVSSLLAKVLNNDEIKRHDGICLRAYA